MCVAQLSQRVQIRSDCHRRREGRSDGGHSADVGPAGCPPAQAACAVEPSRSRYVLLLVFLCLAACRRIGPAVASGVPGYCSVAPPMPCEQCAGISGITQQTSYPALNWLLVWVCKFYFFLLLCFDCFWGLPVLDRIETFHTCMASSRNGNGHNNVYDGGNLPRAVGSTCLVKRRRWQMFAFTVVLSQHQPGHVA